MMYMCVQYNASRKVDYKILLIFAHNDKKRLSLAEQKIGCAKFSVYTITSASLLPVFEEVRQGRGRRRELVCLAFHHHDTGARVQLSCSQKIKQIMQNFAQKIQCLWLDGKI